MADECFSFLGSCIKLINLLEGGNLKGSGKHFNKQEIRGMRRKVFLMAKSWLSSCSINPFIFLIACMCTKLQLKLGKIFVKNSFHVCLY